jgi:predicted nucleotidyltransferase
MTKINWEDLNNKTVEDLNRFIVENNMEESKKLVFVSSGFSRSYAFYSKLKEAFDDFIEKESISGYWSMVDLYGDWVVYQKLGNGLLEPLGRIKDIFGWR